ncbi:MULTISPECIES: D-alanyl-D-alanine carboxypeptidase/D-alanyl-D-alanine-endopeptidase [unclassified Niallia]|uniref:D-alanyl-D-alanine carboxypeptidase/D-alanyl-D-alanine endopeptidase n=1 Tax=unclassified Niallia TaxID=2837522 RepID=UPI001EDA5141|nr:MULTISPECIES: D-alanyl-D-alanine carboxypeptidase/D-alanyl-D-alanine-endopeptidase [unclassified Niallia]MDL0434780.1 D-alanyl-D-alanine carboxypeptidase/D-alanyl-D-alanine-endopeptidase [Niallia sp. SS-2023]UPO89398.1 D-alanyl-D-alanine carboxypeptidase/D-alanyl-D-alanine-endopeptidase [Niallia sp. Man26]
MLKRRKFVLLPVMIGMIVLQLSGTISFHVEANAKGNEGELNSQMNSLLNTIPELKGSLTGISIRDQNSGQVLFEQMAVTRLAPASNLKLLTAAAALSVLGPDYRFQTEIYTDGKLEDGVLSGNVYLKGKGDTTLLASDLDKIAEHLHAKGINQINGSIIGDASWYDDVPYSVDLAWSDESTYYGAPVSALTMSPDKEYDAGTIMMKVKPGAKAGSRALVSVLPSSLKLEINNKTTTAAQGAKEDIEAEREHGGESISLKGNIPKGAEETKVWVAVESPPDMVLDVFTQALAKQNITWTGQVKEGKTPDLSTPIIVHKSMPLSELLIPFMKLSNNTIGETLLKEMGRVEKGEGSFDEGIAVLRDQLTQFGLDKNKILLRDGSGISPIDLITANDLSTLLFNVQKHAWFPIYEKALPVSGNKDRMIGGTLRNRLFSENTKGAVKAKTGTLSAVSSLSGYVRSKSGKTYIFSILLNHLMDEKQGKAIEDQIVELLASQ